MAKRDPMLSVSRICTVNDT